MKQICSINGEIQPLSAAHIPLSVIEYQYGFGVYESLKIRNNILYFVDKHVERLFESARQIDLHHSFSKEQIQKFITAFVSELQEESCNIKMLLYGPTKERKPMFILLASLPLYPKRSWCRDGVSLMSFEHERFKPKAKTLNMLPSYYLYKKTKHKGCYDALLYDRNKNIIEGTRTNIYCIKDKVIYMPPEDKILDGVTMLSLKKVVQKNQDYHIEHQNIPFESLQTFDGMFLSSTSAKILPIKKVDAFQFKVIPDSIHHLIKLYDGALEQSNGKFSRL